MKKNQMMIVFILVVVCCLSVVAGAFIGASGETPTPTPPPPTPTPEQDPEQDPVATPPPPCERDKSFTEQTGSFECESIEGFKPESATWWGTWINSSVPISSTEAVARNESHTFHELSSSANEKKYIAMRKTDQHCKMVQFDITKEGNTCSYKINDAGYAGYGGGGMGAEEACTATTDAEVIAKWNAKTHADSARTAATDGGYGLKSLGYSLNC